MGVFSPLIIEDIPENIYRIHAIIVLFVLFCVCNNNEYAEREIETAKTLK